MLILFFLHYYAKTGTQKPQINEVIVVFFKKLINLWCQVYRKPAFDVKVTCSYNAHHFLTFETKEKAEFFLKEKINLIVD
jgi:hypothetical protein